MPRLDDDQYRRLKDFLAYFDAKYLRSRHPGLADEARPIAILEATEKASKARAAGGLRMAVNDIVEMTLNWPPPEVAELDRELQARGVITLSEVRASYSKKLAAVVRRGRIRGEVEHYLVKGVLDGASEALPAVDQLRLSAMLAVYEAAQA